MNFFFALNFKNFNCKITIPKFTNEGKKLKNISLFSCKIKNDNWFIKKYEYKEDNNFFYVNVIPDDSDNVFFINEDFFKIDEEVNISELKQFYKIKTNFTFRANLRIYNNENGSSSYQSEYPFEMSNKKGSILSTVSSFINEQSHNFIAFRQIHYLPIKKPFKTYLVDLLTEEILLTNTFYTNSTNIVNLSKVKFSKNTVFYADGFLGIPIFISYRENYGVSMEHSHPPHLYIQSKNKFEIVSNLKNKVKKIVGRKY